MDMASATLLSQLGLVWWWLVSESCRRLQQRLAKAKGLKEAARGLHCSASWPARLTSEGLFRFKSLCLGGLEWFLRDNAWLEAGGALRAWIEFGQLLSRWGSEGKTKGKLFPAHPQEGRIAEPAAVRRASCTVRLQRPRVHDGLLQNTNHPWGRQSGGLARFPEPRERQRWRQITIMHFSLSSDFRSRLLFPHKKAAKASLAHLVWCPLFQGVETELYKSVALHLDSFRVWECLPPKAREAWTVCLLLFKRWSQEAAVKDWRGSPENWLSVLMS